MAERKRIGVPISGLDTSTPDHSVVDGKCETLHNLRYTGDAWRNVKDFVTVISSIPSSIGSQFKGVSFVYKHPYDTSDSYICIANKQSKNISLIRATCNKYTKEWSATELAKLQNSHTFSYNHFGSILAVCDDTSKEFTYFQLRQEGYIKISVEDFDLQLSYELGKSALSSEYDTFNSFSYVKEAIYSNASGTTGGLLIMDLVQNHSWRGEIAVIATVEDSDGVLLYTSTPMVINTCQVDIEEFNAWVEDVGSYSDAEPTHTLEVYKGDSDTTTVNVVANNFSAWNGQWVMQKLIDNGMPYSRLYIPQISIRLNKELFKFKGATSVVKIWTTRLYPIFDVDKLIKDAYTKSGSYIVPLNETAKYFANNDLFNQPFYLLKKINIIDDFKAESSVKDYYTYSFSIDGTELENVIHQPLYNASITFTEIYSNVIKEYNNRWHLASPTIKVGNSLFKYLTTQDYASEYNGLVIEKVVNGNTYYHRITRGVYYSNEQNTFLLSAPLNTTKIFFTGTARNAVYPTSLGASLGRSIYLNRSEWASSIVASDVTKSQLIAVKPYANIILGDHSTGDSWEDFEFNNFTVDVADTNRLQVSSANNNFSFEYANSYRFGTPANKILAVNSAAIEMSDSKFGEFPLYVFTTEGIFALQSGKETLYSAVIPINYDVIINPNTLAINGAVLYITEKGLFAMDRSGVTLLSTPIHTSNNRIPQWLRTTKMVYLPEWNEILCTDIENNKAYVLSLNSKVWSTRNLPSGTILNNNELVSNNKIVTLTNEAETFSEVPFVTHHKWECDWGLLDANTKGKSTNYLKDIATPPYLYRPDNDAYINAFKFHRMVEWLQEVITSSDELKYFIHKLPREINDDWRPIESLSVVGNLEGEFGAVFITTLEKDKSGSNMNKPIYKCGDKTIKFTLVSRDSSSEYKAAYGPDKDWYECEIDSEEDMGNLWDYIVHHQLNYKILSRPEQIEENSRIYYGFNKPLEASDEQPEITLYWLDNENKAVKCFTNDWSDSVIYTAKVEIGVVGEEEDTPDEPIEEENTPDEPIEEENTPDEPIEEEEETKFHQWGSKWGLLDANMQGSSLNYMQKYIKGFTTLAANLYRPQEEHGHLEGFDIRRQVREVIPGLEAPDNPQDYADVPPLVFIAPKAPTYDIEYDQGDWSDIEEVYVYADRDRAGGYYKIATLTKIPDGYGYTHSPSYGIDEYAAIELDNEVVDKGFPNIGYDKGYGGYICPIGMNQEAQLLILWQKIIELELNTHWVYHPIVDKSQLYYGFPVSDDIDYSLKVGDHQPTIKLYNFEEMLEEGWNYNHYITIYIINEDDSAERCYTTGKTIEVDQVEYVYAPLMCDCEEDDDEIIGGGEEDDGNIGEDTLSDHTSFSLRTRPIKLGTMELKRAETIIVRFESDVEQELNVLVEGSVDTRSWGVLREMKVVTNKDIEIRRTPCSVKYLRFTIQGRVSSDIRILAFELEYYERMRHRMR